MFTHGVTRVLHTNIRLSLVKSLVHVDTCMSNLLGFTMFPHMLHASNKHFANKTTHWLVMHVYELAMHVHELAMHCYMY